MACGHPARGLSISIRGAWGGIPLRLGRRGEARSVPLLWPAAPGALSSRQSAYLPARAPGLPAPCLYQPRVGRDWEVFCPGLRPLYAGPGGRPGPGGGACAGAPSARRPVVCSPHLWVLTVRRGHLQIRYCGAGRRSLPVAGRWRPRPVPRHHLGLRKPAQQPAVEH